jgi:glycerol kinase
MQIEADILGCTVERPVNIESTALGAAMLAGLGIGIWTDVGALSKIRSVERRFEPEITAQARRNRLKVWKKAVKRSGGWAKAS